MAIISIEVIPSKNGGSPLGGSVRNGKLPFPIPLNGKRLVYV